MIHLALLGNVELTSDGHVISDAPLRRSKRVVLLAYLAVAKPRGFHRRDKVAALFWPELPTDRARAALRTTLSRLREDHDAELLLGRGSEDIAVDATKLECDVVQFDDALDAGRLDDAVHLYRGPFLDGIHVEGAGEELESWLAAERARLREGYLRALGAVSAEAESRGDLVSAVAAAHRALDSAPADEIIGRRLIVLLAAAGNNGAALGAYDDLARRLEREFGVAPAPETQRLVARLRESRPAPVDAFVNTGDGTSERASPPASPILPTMATPLRRAAYVIAAVVLTVVVVGGGAWAISRPSPAGASVTAAEWQPVTPIGNSPAGSYGARAVLDSTGDALLVFGGVIDVQAKRLVPFDSYWRLRGLHGGTAASWRRLDLQSGPHPTPRWIFGASSDAEHDRVILHGGALGFTSPCANDTWVLEHASGIGQQPAWRQVHVRGAAAPARASFDQVWDAGRRRLIVFAGHDCVFPSYHDTWVLAFDDSTLASGAWSLLVPDSSSGLPLQRDDYVAAYDSAASRLFIFGGRASGLPTGELWALDHASGIGGVPAWHQVQCAGSPPAMSHPGAAMDAARDTWTMFGGLVSSLQMSRATWQLHGLLRDVTHCRWAQVEAPDPSPAARSAASAALLAGSRGMVIFGGEFRNTPLSDAWVLR